MELVSIVITTYKGYEKLSRAIDSALAQTYPNIEIIVVDDNMKGTEERYLTEKVMKLYQNDNIIYIKHYANRNGAVARNTGIQAANGKYITFLDDDDYIVENRVEEAVIQLKKNSASVFLCSVCLVKKDFIKIVHIPTEICVKDILLNENVIGTGSNLFLEMNVVNAVYGFDESFIRYQDREFLIRVFESGKVCTFDRIQVIKSENSQNNVPNYYAMKEVENRFINKFTTEFNALSIQEKKQYELNKMHMLFKLVLDTEDIGEIEEVYGSLKSEKDLFWYEMIFYIFAKLNTANLSRVKQKIVPFMARLKNIKYFFEIREHKELWRFIKYKEG